MTTLTEIVDILVADHGASDTGVRSVEHDLGVFEGVGGVSIRSGSHVTEITVVSDFGSRSSVSLASRVVMRSSSLASLSEVTYRLISLKIRVRSLTVLVDVESVLTFSESLELSSDLDLLAFNLAHLSYSRDTRVIVGVKNTDCEMFCSFDHLILDY